MCKNKLGFESQFLLSPRMVNISVTKELFSLICLEHYKIKLKKLNFVTYGVNTGN